MQDNANGTGGVKVATINQIPEVPVTDVQVNGTSVVTSGVANVPIATTTSYGVVKPSNSYGLQVYGSGNTSLGVLTATDANIKSGSSVYAVTQPSKQHQAAFYGLAKAAGDSTQSASSNAVGTYTDNAKSAIRTMLGATSPDIIAVQDAQPSAADNKIWIAETAPSSVQVPTVDEMNTALAGKVSDVTVNGSSVVTDGVAAIPPSIPSGGSTGQVLKKTSGTDYDVSWANESGAVTDVQVDGTSVVTSGVANIPASASPDIIVVQDAAPSSAGNKIWISETTPSSVQVPTTDEMNTALAGKVSDVQVNGTSIVTSGVANIPVASSSAPGAVLVSNQYGLAMNSSSGLIYINKATSGQIKAGSSAHMPIVTNSQHESVFYGLAKAAGDTSQASSSNAVGTYTADAKAAIQTMLGVTPATIAALVDIPLIETVTGTTPTITGQPNTRYNCGEVTSISITPPSSGGVDVFFTSGSTPALLTVPNTVVWPEWFDATTLDTNTVYEILIIDGTYGSVMTWAT